MLGHIIYTERRGVLVHLSEEELLGLPLLRAGLPRTAGRRRVRSAAKKLVRQGVRRVLTPADFPFWPELEAWGLAPVDPVDFCRAMSPKLALAALKHCGLRPAAASVALRGERVTRAMRLAALELCTMVRGMVVSAPIGGDGLQTELRREFGVPALAEGGRSHPDVALHFSPAPGGGGQVFCLYGPAPNLLEYQINTTKEELPDDCDSLPLLAALWETGRLSVQDLDVIPRSDT